MKSILALSNKSMKSLVLFSVLAAQMALADTPRIDFLEPVDPQEGQLLTIRGTGFGMAPGPNGPREVSLAPVSVASGGNFTGATPSIPVPIVEWTRISITVLVKCP